MIAVKNTPWTLWLIWLVILVAAAAIMYLVYREKEHLGGKKSAR